MSLDKILSDAYMIKDLKKEINEDIKKNLDKINIDKLALFDFIHKVDRLDIMIEMLLDDVKKAKGLKTTEYDNNKISNQEDIKEYTIKRTSEKLDKQPVNMNEQVKVYKKTKDVNEFDKAGKIESIKNDEHNQTHKKAIEDAYDRIAKLEKIMSERNIFRKEEDIQKMKDFHTAEEREEMLEKKHIKAESFTPKAKVQSDPTMDKTVAMSREEFYRELDNSMGSGTSFESKTEILDNINYDEDEEEYYDAYEEEKGNGLLGKFKDFIGK